MSAFRAVVLAITVVVSLCAQAAGGEGPAPPALPACVLVGLATGQNSVALSLPAGATLGGPQGLAAQYAEETSLVFTLDPDGALMAGGTAYGRGPLTIAPGAGFLKWGNRPYRGEFLLVAGDRGITLINRVGLEDYLRGVVPAEVSHSWHPEALKAQAVAARTFALTRLGYHRRDGFDLCASNDCQIYTGMTAEKAETDQAVLATAGQVLVYRGKPVLAYYHSASGGHTENVEDIWHGAANPGYLKGVPDPAGASPHDQWRIELDWSAAEALVSGKYPALGRLVAVTIASRTPGGRASLVELAGDRASIRIGGEAFRALFGLKSALCEVQTEYGAVPVPRLEDLAGAPVLHALSPSAAALWTAVEGGEWTLTPIKLVITGRGWGHGVGMSQWGAKALAELGYTYLMILQYYYSGTEVQDWRPAAGQGEPADAGRPL